MAESCGNVSEAAKGASIIAQLRKVDFPQGCPSGIMSRAIVCITGSCEIENCRLRKACPYAKGRVKRGDKDD